MDADQIEIGGTAVQRVESHALAMPDVGRLMELALGQGEGGVESLERLVALQERMLTIQAEQAMNAALAQFHSRSTPVPKTNRVDYVTKSGARVNYNFAPLNVIATHIRPALAECGLSYSWNERPSGEQHTEYECVLHHEFGATRHATTVLPNGSGSSPQMNDAQRTIATQSYGRRATLIQVLGLTTADDDVDGQVPSEAISDEQLANIEALLAEVGASARWVKWWLQKLGVSSLSDLPVSRYEGALAELEAKRGEVAS